MALTNVFREAVAEGSVRKIRIMLKDSLLVDPTFEEFEEMERAASHVAGLYDDHDGRSFNENPAEWDDQYMNKIMVQVVGNFSHERVDHLKAIVCKLRPVQQAERHEAQKKVNSNANSDRKLSYQEQKKKDQQDGTYKYAGGIAGGALAGGVVGCAGGSLASLSVGGIIGCTIGGAVVGAVVGGAIVFFSSEKE